MNEEVPAFPHPDKKPLVDQSSNESNSKYPVGLIFIVILTGMAMLGTIMTIVNPMIIIGTYVITGIPAFFYGVIQMGVYVTLFIWLIQIKEWGRILGIVVSIYNILLTALAFLSFIYYPNEMMAAYDTVMPGYSKFMTSDILSIFFGLMVILNCLVGGAVILYLHFRKKYFRVNK